MSTNLKEKKFDLPVSSAHKACKIAADRINEMEFPSRKTEDWRYLKLGALLKKNYNAPSISNPDISGFMIPDLDAHIVVLSNGFLNDELSNYQTSNELTIQNINSVDSDAFNNLSGDSKEIFNSINTAYFQGGVSIKVKRNAIIEKPVYIINITEGESTIIQSRNLIELEQGAELDLIEGNFSIDANGNLTNSVNEYFVAKNAKLSVTKIQDVNNNSNLISTEEAYQEQDSTFKITTVSISGKLIRNGVNIKVDGTNCYTEMNGWVSTHNDQTVDNHTRVDHLKSNCISSELYKYILRDKSTGVFNGKVIVHQDAQVIEAYQQNNNIVLNDDATMNTKPELEIYADDVKCSHGTTTGQFDERAIFYLQARGVSKDAAKELLVEAFAEEVLEKISNEKVQDFIRERSI